MQAKENNLYSRIRLRFIFLLIFLIVFLLIARLFYLISLSEEDFIITGGNKIFSRRGDIYDRNGYILAVSDELYSIYANPYLVKDLNKTAFELSLIIDESSENILQKLKTKKSFVWIKRQVSPRIANLVKEKNLNGISVQREYKRLYPAKNLASHILGFCDIDGEGKEGIEKSMNDYLTPKEKPGSYNFSLPAGDNVILTIDSFIQAVAEKTISNAVKKENALAGSFILMDGTSGEILAMANYPDFDPNNYTEYQQKDFRNYALFYQFEPGSVFKIFNIAALIDMGLITPNDFFYCEGGYSDNNITINCTGTHGVININGIVKYSCNTAMIKAAINIKNKDLYNYLKFFGFGELTGIILPGEQKGTFRDVTKWSINSKKFISIGQEVSVNALQIVKAATAFVNDGEIVSPLIVKKVISNNGEVIKEFSTKKETRVIKKGVARFIIDAMKTACEPGGTVSRLNVDSIDFGAKSGTAQIYDIEKKKYVDDEVTSSLLLIFPSNKPKYIAYMVFHVPKGKIRWGGVIGAYAFNYFFSMTAQFFNIFKNEVLIVNEEDLAIKTNYKKIQTLPTEMPDLTGLTAMEAISIFSECNVDFKLNGTGRIIKHIPESGSIINENDTIILYLSH